MNHSRDTERSGAQPDTQAPSRSDGAGVATAEANRLPRVDAVDTAGDPARLELFVPHDLACLEGHFPDIAIVPGVAMIGWAEHFAREILGCNGELRDLERLKFNQLVRPGRALVLQLMHPQAGGDGREVAYRFQSPADGRDLASGRLIFH